MLFALVQLASALWLYGRLPLRAGPAWLGSLHRISGRVAFLFSLPVAYHCLYQLAFQDSTARVLLHSLLGCAFYGAFAAKVVIVRSHALPGWALPIAGGLVFTILVVGLADERPVVHLREWHPLALTRSRGVDRVLAPLTALAAAFAVIVLLIGPELIGREGGRRAPRTARSGKQIFTAEGCGGCHTLADAGASGHFGAEPRRADAGRGDGRGEGPRAAAARCRRSTSRRPSCRRSADYVAGAAGR